MPATARPSILRKMLHERFSLLADELAAEFELEQAAHDSRQRDLVRGELAESLNQAVRRLRQADDFSQLAAVLADSSTTFCRILAVFSIDGETAHAERSRGLSDPAADALRNLRISLADAPALATAIHSGDPVVSLTSPREISPALAELFAHPADERACILPLMARGRPAGIVYAAGTRELAPLELMAQAAALALEARPQPPEPPRKPDLVMIQGGRSAPPRKVPESWAELSADDQELHLRAQRFARVQVAGMRLFSPEAVQQGRRSKNLYGALQKDIDAGREIFRQSFLSASSTMLDYFHLELLRTLANDDASLLGEKYPGPLA